MKIILISFLLAIVSFGKVEHYEIHKYNQKPSIRIKQQKLLKQYVKIDPEKITKQITGEKIEYKRLKHQINTIYFEVWTKHYYLWIDAQTGKVLKKEKR
ncbi:hypothetical protein [Nitratiruptor tergarcus]|uniref:Peptidase propeptide and YPEB domain-containing protein n=1 Tax=Nitratiruptor tergarcus DSM 16512 TaxID=1069081 RepID=A0A1W1WVD8_9BACT|nr:hypothetical protein [Nitratiruptor tergarcus]SMC09703.1 hypothetical protein SAMN05660197_1525 [Nitratiruptor tergarcus DSM 16512]